MRPAIRATSLALMLGLSTPAVATDLSFLLPSSSADLGPIAWHGLIINPDLGFETFSFTGSGSPLLSDAEGLRIGAEASYDWQAGNIVYGIAADASWANIDGDEVEGSAVLRGSRINAVGSLRGRLGYAVERWMVYGTAGFAMANLEIDAPGLGLSDSQTLSGWTAGAGVEFAWNKSTQLRASYRRIDLGEAEFSSLPAGSNEVGAEANVFDLGFVRRF